MNRSRTQASAAAQRMADWAIRLWLGSRRPIEELERLGCTFEQIERDTWTAEGPAGIRVGISLYCDPLAQVAQIGYLLLGPLWSLAVPDAVPEVERIWKGLSEQRQNRPRPVSNRQLEFLLPEPRKHGL